MTSRRLVRARRPSAFPIRVLPALCAALGVLVLATGPARAQAEPVIIGGSGLAPIEVNPRALDRLGPLPSGPGPTLPGVALAPEAPIELTPPPGVEPIIAHTAKPVLPEPMPEPVFEPEEPSMALESEIPPAGPEGPEALAGAEEPSVTAPAAPEAPVMAEEALPTAPSAAPAAPAAAPEAPAAAPFEAEIPETAAAPEPSPAAPESEAALPAPAGPEAAPAEALPAEAGAPEPAPAEVTPAPAPAGETAVAALTPAEQPGALEPLASGQVMRIAFGTEQAELPADAGVKLGALAQQLKADEEARLQLKAYASGTAETASQARRLSLSRALAVRAFLIEQGVRSTRIDVRALGIPEDEGPADRVDVILVRR